MLSRKKGKKKCSECEQVYHIVIENHVYWSKWMFWWDRKYTDANRDFNVHILTKNWIISAGLWVDCMHMNRRWIPCEIKHKKVNMQSEYMFFILNFFILLNFFLAYSGWKRTEFSSGKFHGKCLNLHKEKYCLRITNNERNHFFSSTRLVFRLLSGNPLIW